VVVVLDTGILGMASHPNRASPENKACALWLAALIENRVEIVVPEIADYELRRELLRLGSAKSIARLDALEAEVTYLPITTDAMKRAAQLWADVRNAGLPTAVDKALDADVILAAQALLKDGAGLVVATTNVGHLARFVPAKLWSEIEIA
jgi:predicted nucleic acid-binding protein